MPSRRASGPMLAALSLAAGATALACLSPAAYASERKIQRPTTKVALPSAINAPGYTTIVPRTIKTNAGQFVFVEVICRKVNRSAPTPSCHTHTDLAGKVQLHVDGSGPVRAVIRLSAPKVPGFTAYSLRQEVVAG